MWNSRIADSSNNTHTHTHTVKKKTKKMRKSAAPLNTSNSPAV